MSCLVQFAYPLSVDVADVCAMQKADMTSRDLLEPREPRQLGRKRILLPVILRSAMELFGRCGFEQPTMEQVASVAGVRKATLYSYFDSKSALIDAVIDQWLREMPVARPVDARAPLRQQLIDIGRQLEKFAAHPVAVALSRHFAGVERQVSRRHLETWRKRNADYEDFLATLLERHCSCERSHLVAHQFLLLVTGDPGSECAGLRMPGKAKIEGAVELILRAYPEQASQ
jgi:AcrR family transcriptional regulator